MKKSFVLGVFGVMAITASSFGQGYISLDNYNSNGGSWGPGFILYGAGIPANGISGPFGTPGTGLGTGWTVGLYFVAGTPVVNDPAGSNIPDLQLALATGGGSTASVAAGNVFGNPGVFFASSPFNVSASGTPTITAVVVVYSTSAGSYAAAQYRAHSAPFTMPSNGALALPHPYIGDYFTSFTVDLIPEPGTLALAGLGGLSLLMFRRKKA